MFELATLYRDTGDLPTAEERATDGLEASQRVGDRYYVPRNLTILADLKARRGRLSEANALYEQAEDVIESMLISVDEPYWNSSVAASMSQTYLQHFELVTKSGDVPGAFNVLERVRGRTRAWPRAKIRVRLLRNAKLDLLSKYGGQVSPFYWAAFIAVGETSTPIGIKQQ